MKSTILLLTTLTLGACANNTPTPPDEDFYAYGNYRHQLGAMEIAQESAEKFCKRFKAAPGYKDKQIAKNGSIIGDIVDTVKTLENLPKPDQVEKLQDKLPHKPSLSRWIPSDKGYDVRLTYRCY